jgi:hypothetical protein
LVAIKGKALPAHKDKKHERRVAIMAVLAEEEEDGANFKESKKLRSYLFIR